MSGRFAVQVAGLVRRIGLFLLIGVLAAPAGAVTVSGLYTAEVAVEGSGQEALRDGYARGMQQVLLRVSGSRDVLEQEEVRALLENAENYLQSYQFLGAAESEGTDRLRMSFGAVGINRALAGADAPVWGSNRPLTLALVAVQAGGSRELVVDQEVSSDDAGEPGPEAGSGIWLTALHEAAARRGLPLTLPPGEYGNDADLLSDIWGQFDQRLEQAASTISHDLLATVRIRQQGGAWQAAWSLNGRGVSESGSNAEAATPELLADQVVGRWADVLAARYAVAAGDVGELPQVEMVIRGVSSLGDYARINRILEELTPVHRVGASRVAGDRLELTVVFNGELDQLREYVALDPRFVAVEGQQDPAPEPRPQAQPQQSPSANSDEPVEAVINPLVRYQSLMVEEEESEEVFGSLYQVLHYRWEPQPGVVREGDSGED
jgi:hypothetical protein